MMMTMIMMIALFISYPGIQGFQYRNVNLIREEATKAFWIGRREHYDSIFSLVIFKRHVKRLLSVEPITDEIQET